MTASDFPTTEFEARTERAQRAMTAGNLDALLFMTEPEVRYLTGFRTLFWQSPTRPWFVILKQSGKPIAVIPEIGGPTMAGTWIDDIRTWSSPHADDDGISLLTSVLKGSDKIGLPMGRESQLCMPLSDFNRLTAALPGSTWVDCSPLIQGLRMVKSEAEIDTIRSICQIASTSFARAPELFHLGQPVSEAFRAFKIDLLRQGAEDVPYLVGGCAQDGYTDVISPPSDRPITAGDILMLDTGATLKGYFCDFDRNWAFGAVSDACHRAYEALHKATDAALSAARPGIRAADIHSVMAEALECPDSNVGRFGHGLGMQLTEPPSLIDFDDTVLAPGMTLTLEPSLTFGEGLMMATEENIVIRDGAPELLTDRAPALLPVLSS